MENESLLIALGSGLLLIIGLFQWVQRLIERADTKRQEMFTQIEELTLKNATLELNLTEQTRLTKEVELDLLQTRKTARQIHKKNKFLLDKLKELGYNE